MEAKIAAIREKTKPFDAETDIQELLNLEQIGFDLGERGEKAVHELHDRYLLNNLLKKYEGVM